MEAQVRLALFDVWMGVRSFPLWSFLSINDIRQRYNRSFLGPFWMAIGLGATVIGIGLLYSSILKTPLSSFLPYLAISLLIWYLFSASITEASTAFLASSSVLRQRRLPLSALVVRVISRNVLVAAHNLPVVVLTWLFARRGLPLVSPIALIGLAGALINLGWMCLVVAALSVRYRDVPQIVMTVIQLTIFITPVFWDASLIKHSARAAYLWANPFYYMLQGIRGPLFEGVVDIHWYIGDLVIALVGWIVALGVFSIERRKISLWV